MSAQAQKPEFLLEKASEVASLLKELAEIRARLASLANPQSELPAGTDSGPHGRAAR